MKNTQRHPPPFDLDRFIAGELFGDAELYTRVHLEICETCNSYVKKIAADRDALLFQTPPETFAYRIENLASLGESRTRQYESGIRKGAMIAVIASAACLLVFLSLSPQKTATTRWMGNSPAVKIYVNRNGNTQTISGSKPLVGDRLRYKVTIPQGQKAYAVLVGIEDGRVFPLIPDRIDSEPFRVSGETMLPGSVEIEPGNSDTVLFLIVREKSFAIRDIVNEVKSKFAVAPDKLDVPGVVSRIQTNPASP